MPRDREQIRQPADIPRDAAQRESDQHKPRCAPGRICRTDRFFGRQGGIRERGKQGFVEAIVRSVPIRHTNSPPSIPRSFFRMR